MSRYVMVRMTVNQLYTALNACDLIRDQYEAAGNKREALSYRRACETLDKVLKRA